MKIEILRDCKWFFKAGEPLQTFKKGEIVDLQDPRAEKLVLAKNAKKEKKEKKVKKNKQGVEVENKVIESDENK